MLTPRVFTATTFDRKPYDIDFVSAMIDGSEYYELKSKDFHYGYMTEALVNKIFETRPSSKDRYVDSFSFETKVKDHQQYLKLKNRIILDLPSTIDEANAFSAFSFYGIKYAEDPKKEPIFISSKIGFSLSGVNSEIEFIFPDNRLNCGGFNIHDVNKGLTTIEIDAPNGNIKSININSFTFPGNEEKDTHLSVTFEKEWGELLVNNSYIPTYPGESGYLRIKTGDQLSLVNGGINSDNQKDLDLLLLESSKSIVIHDAHLFFSQTEKYLKDRPFVGISGDGSIHLLYNDCYINGLVQNDQSLEVVAPNPKETYKRYSFFITNSTFKSPVVLSLTIENNVKLSNFDKVSDSFLKNITKNGGKKVGRELNDFSSSADPEKAGNFENPVSIFNLIGTKIIHGSIKYPVIKTSYEYTDLMTFIKYLSLENVFLKNPIFDYQTRDIRDGNDLSRVEVINKEKQIVIKAKDKKALSMINPTFVISSKNDKIEVSYDGRKESAMYAGYFESCYFYGNNKISFKDVDFTGYSLFLNSAAVVKNFARITSAQVFGAVELDGEKQN